MRAWMVALLIGTMLAGCLSTSDTDGAPDQTKPAMDAAVIDAGNVRMDVPVPIFLIGFPDGSKDALEAQLQPMVLSGAGAMIPTADFTVHAPEASWQAAFDSFIDGAKMDGHGDATGFAGTILDGNGIEEYLAANLAAIHDVPDGITSLVILDAGLRGHAYHYAGDVGWREPVRTFGEHSSLLIWDPHAEPDPWVGTAQPHHVPVTSASTELLVDWVARATAIRALQMPIWPPTTQACHAVTVVLAVRGTTVTPDALGLQSWQDVLDVERLESTFANLTGDPVHVDLVVKQLPQDDPPLEATTRENNARAITQTYLDLNFDAYHVAHDGCEPYLSLVVYGDLGDQRTSSNGNAAMLASGRRISTSLVAENVRVMTEEVGYNDVWDESTSFERVGPGANPLEWFNWVVSHETGHLFSLPHPNYSNGAASHSDTGFASTWNVMGYQMRRIVTETSLVDTNNMARNQAAYAVLEAHAAGTSDEALADALQAMGEYRWKDATQMLRGPDIAPELHAHDDA